ncbi:MAG: polyprenyl diphosphate synthase [Gammaproteobacteria bacterium]
MSADSKANPANENKPRHIAIIMDGNGRWAQQRYMPRAMGHRAGVGAVRAIVEYCAQEGIEVLTLFAFSSENWRRPKEEVALLMDLFVTTLQQEVDKLDRNGIRLRFIGDRSAFSEKLRDKITSAETQTKDNKRLTLVVAANYGGRWDLAQAFRRITEKIERGELKDCDIDETLIAAHLSTSELPEPDLFIRTGGEQRVSNFLLWQLAYTELYFTPILWPDFDRNALVEAVKSFQGRQRRFGHTGEQVVNKAVSL